MAKCKRCGYEWIYLGKSEYYACCPRCKSSVKLNKKVDIDFIIDKK